jgi:hypothetical protein
MTRVRSVCPRDGPSSERLYSTRAGPAWTSAGNRKRQGMARSRPPWLCRSVKIPYRVTTSRSNPRASSQAIRRPAVGTSPRFSQGTGECWLLPLRDHRFHMVRPLNGVHYYSLAEASFRLSSPFCSGLQPSQPMRASCEQLPDAASRSFRRRVARPVVSCAPTMP